MCGSGGGDEGIPLVAQRAHTLFMLMLPGPLATQAGDGAGASDLVQPRRKSSGKRVKGASLRILEAGPLGLTSPLCEPDGI